MNKSMLDASQSPATSLSAGDSAVRLTEALPWVLRNFPDLDWK